MKGIANRQNKLLGRKPLPFGGGRPVPGRSGMKQMVNEPFHRRKPRQGKDPSPESDVPGKKSSHESEPDPLDPALSDDEFPEGETPKNEEAEK